MRAIALSYVIDAALLLAFAIAGTIAFATSLIYLASGLSCCVIFALLAAQAATGRASDIYLRVPLLIVSASIQLVFIDLAPQIGFYFLNVLFIVFGIGSMGLTALQSALTGIGVAVAILALGLTNGTAWVPHSSAFERALVCTGFAATLGRCLLLAVYGRALRARLRTRGSQLSASVEALRGLVTSALHNAEIVAAASTEMNQGNLDLSKRTEAQSGALQEIASTMSELTFTIGQNADRSKQANQLAIDASAERWPRGGTGR
jgi:hypothetical protein